MFHALIDFTGASSLLKAIFSLTRMINWED